MLSYRERLASVTSSIIMIEEDENVDVHQAHELYLNKCKMPRRRLRPTHFVTQATYHDLMQYWPQFGIMDKCSLSAFENFMTKHSAVQSSDASTNENAVCAMQDAVK